VTGAPFARQRRRSVPALRACLLFSLAMAACGGRLDAGWDETRGLLPVDERNAIVLCNDGYVDNWQGEYAMLLANTGGPRLAGIIINDSWPWPEIEENVAGWEQMVAAARESGLRDIPDPLRSNGPVLVRPGDDNIDSTVANGSEGAQLILEAAARLAKPYRPLVVVTGGRPTDVADAYLMDHTLPDRVVVISSMGTPTADGGEMGTPNGEMDTWADIIVAREFRYIQVSDYYQQKDQDVPSSLLPQLPANAFTAWIASKQPNVWESEVATDQVGVLAAAIPSFVSTAVRVVQQGVTSNGMPAIVADPSGPDWLVTKVNDAVARARLWEMLLDLATYGSE
jgi:hypothetical protein